MRQGCVWLGILVAAIGAGILGILTAGAIWLDLTSPGLIITNDDGRIHISGPAWHDEAGTPQMPTIRTHAGEERWEVEILADRYEARRPK